MDPTVPAAEFGSADHFATVLRRDARADLLDTRTLGLITGIARDVGLDAAAKVARILNAIEASEQVDKEFDAQGFSRTDEDPQPVAGRVPPHFEDGVTGAVVEVASEPTECTNLWHDADPLDSPTSCPACGETD